MLVYVLNKHGTPLMPCKPQRARKLLKKGKAKVVKKTPFTIQLKYGSSGYKQPINLGVDPGYTHVGMSAITSNKEVYASDTQLRTDVKKLLSERRAHRKNRRNRKTRYRKPRFKNRSREKGWLAPSIRHKLDSMVKLVNQVASILPVTKVVVEVASFDIQKIKKPDMQGEEYQNGEQKGFTNVREYVLHRDDHTCQHCKGKSKDNVLNVHHIESRKTGSNRPDNLITLCSICHKAYHNGEIVLNSPDNGFREETFMTSVRWKLVNVLRDQLNVGVDMTYGHKTKEGRFELALPKSHVNDAYVIAGGNRQERLGLYFYQRQARKQNRKLHRGARSHIKNTTKRVLKGFRRFDKVLYDGIECFIWGRRSSGYFSLKTLGRNTIHNSASCKKLKLLECAGTILTEVRKGQFLPPFRMGSPCPIKMKTYSQRQYNMRC